MLTNDIKLVWSDERMGITHPVVHLSGVIVDQDVPIHLSILSFCEHCRSG